MFHLFRGEGQLLRSSGLSIERFRPCRAKVFASHSGARPQAESPESITIKSERMDSGLASASHRRPGLTRLTKVDTFGAFPPCGRLRPCRPAIRIIGPVAVETGHAP